MLPSETEDSVVWLHASWTPLPLSIYQHGDMVSVTTTVSSNNSSETDVNVKPPTSGLTRVTHGKLKDLILTTPSDSTDTSEELVNTTRTFTSGKEDKSSLPEVMITPFQDTTPSTPLT